MGNGSGAYLLAFSAAVEGREADLVRWYREKHIPELLEHPRIVGATLYRVLDDSSGRLGTLLAAWEVAGDAPAAGIRTELRAYTKTATDALDRARFSTVIAEELAPRRTAAGAPSTGAPFPQTAPALYLVFNDGKEGKQAEFLDEYLNTHIPELLTAPGIVGATRVRITEDSTGVLPSGGAVYELAGDDPRATIAALPRANFTPLQHSDRSRSVRVLVERIAPRSGR